MLRLVSREYVLLRALLATCLSSGRLVIRDRSLAFVSWPSFDISGVVAFSLYELLGLSTSVVGVSPELQLF